VQVALDWAASELMKGGDPAAAVTALEKTAGAAKTGPLAARHAAALADARHAAGVAALRAGQGARAVELLRAAQAAARPTLARMCDLALATVVAGDAAASLAALRAVSGQSCPFPPPADTQAAPILIAFTEGLTGGRAPRALERLTALAGKSTGPAKSLLDTAQRVVALEAARDAYAAGAIAQVKQHLQAARAAPARVGADEVALGLAAVDLAEGRVDAAIAALERLAGKLPEALVHLGIAYEKKGEPQKALDAWRRARKAGVRSAPLAEWIEAKERIYGEAPQ
jgi:tetratricopeptide (TPR) repeat protein